MDQPTKSLTSAKQDLLSRVDRALDDVRPHMAVDGGNVELVDITDEGVVLIRWLGACKNCNMTLMTLKAGLEVTVKNRVSEVIRVEAITESA